MYVVVLCFLSAASSTSVNVQPQGAQGTLLMQMNSTIGTDTAYEDTLEAQESTFAMQSLEDGTALMQRNASEESTMEMMELGSEGACSPVGANCKNTKCCTSPGMKCYEKDGYWAGCKPSCTPGKDPNDPPKYRTPWSCRLLGGGGGSAPAPKPRPIPSGPAPSPSGGLTYLSGNLGTAKTTRYWDCCKPSCAWGGKAAVSQPVKTCGKDGVSKQGVNAKNICGGGGSGGPSYMCTAQTAWYDAAKKMSFGFVAGHVKGLTEKGWCCGCYELRFANTRLPRMVVQVTNTGGDLGENHFDIQVAGGGFGIFDGCTKQWGAPAGSWGARYGGVMASGWGKAGCRKLPPALRKSCEWQFDYLGDNPRVASHFRVACPSEIVQRSQCQRDDDPKGSPSPQPKPPPRPRPAPVRPSPRPSPSPPQPEPSPGPTTTTRRRRRAAGRRRRRAATRRRTVRRRRAATRRRTTRRRRARSMSSASSA